MKNFIKHKIEFDTLTNISIDGDSFLIEGIDSTKPSVYLKNYFKIPSKGKNDDCTLFFEGKDGVTPFKYSKCFPLSERFDRSYFIIDSWIFYRHKNGIAVTDYSKLNHFQFEMKLWGCFFRLHGRVEARALVLRSLYYLFYSRGRKNRKKPIIVFSDRITKAGDNAEEMFRYALREHYNEADYYFAVDTGSESAKNLKKIGKVIKPNGIRYKKLYWQGAVMVSSQGEDWIFRPYKGYTEGFKDLAYRTRYVFLQHGITKDDLSGWLNRANKNISCIVTATSFEYRSFIEGDYGYDSRQVKLTGFPRYDKLDNRPEKLISIVLTWRNYMVEPLQKNGDRPLVPDYEDKTYMKILNELLFTPALADLAEKYGYRLQFMLHPCVEALRSVLLDKCDKRIAILPYSKSYTELFSETALLITDYSSVAFDFAYLRKPIIYFQPDADEFFGGTHMYKKGYFDYRADGFGEVTETPAALTETLRSYLETGCRPNDMYLMRINQTFAFHDKDNCRRVWQEIMNLQ